MASASRKGQVQKKWPQTVFAIKKRGKRVYKEKNNEVQVYLFFTPMSHSGAIFWHLPFKNLRCFKQALDVWKWLFRGNSVGP